MSASTIPANVELWALVTLVALALHLWSEYGERQLARAITKLTASTGFLLTAHAAGALEHDWSRWVFLGRPSVLFGRLRACRGERCKRFNVDEPLASTLSVFFGRRSVLRERLWVFRALRCERLLTTHV